MKEKIKLGFIGVGNWVQCTHIPALQQIPEVEFYATCDFRKEVAKSVAEQYSIPHVFQDYRDLIKLKDLDAVMIVTPNYLHAEASIAALNAKKHVLCEKPMAINYQEANEMIKAQKKSGKILMIGLHNWYKNECQYLKHFVESGRLGKIYYAKSGWLRRRGSPKGWFSNKAFSGGGPLIDLGIHVLSLTLWLMNLPQIERVSSMVSNKLGMYKTKYAGGYLAEFGDGKINDVEDIACAMLHTRNGASIMLDVSWALNCKEDKFYIEIFGDRGGAKLWPLEIYTEINNTLVDIVPKQSQSNAFYEEDKHFIDCILKNKEPLSSGHKVVEFSKIIDAIYQSAEEKAEVKL